MVGTIEIGSNPPKHAECPESNLCDYAKSDFMPNYRCRGTRGFMASAIAVNSSHAGIQTTSAFPCGLLANVSS